MRVLGLSCYYHDAAACLVEDARVVAACQEERFDRNKASADFPLQAVNACLQHAGVTMDDVDAVAFYEKPFLKLERMIISHLRAWPRSMGTFLRTVPPWLQDRLIVPLTVKRELGFDGQVHFCSHHLSHAASSFLASPFEEAAVLTADGIGEWATTTFGHGRGTELELLGELRYPDSLGLLYSAVTAWLGFKALQGEGKVMALADFGEPEHLDVFRRYVPVGDDGSIRVDPRFLSVVEGDRMVGPAFMEAFGEAREPGAELTDHHRNVAASLQRYLELVLVRMARHLHGRVGSPNLCLAGGVCLNISATSRVMEESPFEQVFIQPAAGDAGGSLGAALLVSHALEVAERGPAMESAALGPEYGVPRMRRAVAGHPGEVRTLEEEKLLAEVIRQLQANRVVGWFQGRMEFGPRALGQRSILANPCHPPMKDILNERVKHREPFRPYGVSVLAEEADRFFHVNRPSPFMLQVARVRDEVRDRIPAALHVNGTSRLQTVTEEHNGIYHRLIRAFAAETGVPMVINTSFNDSNEPIVCTPEDAYSCFAATGMDALVIGNLLVEKEPLGSGDPVGPTDDGGER